jgi:hypothetical protein
VRVTVSVLCWHEEVDKECELFDFPKFMLMLINFCLRPPSQKPVSSSSSSLYIYLNLIPDYK